MKRKNLILIVVVVTIVLFIGISIPQYDIYTDGPKLNLRQVEHRTKGFTCGAAFVNLQTDTISVCDIDSQIEVMLKLKALSNNPSIKVVFSNGRYERGLNRTYANNWLSHGLSYTGSIAPIAPCSTLYILVDSVIYNQFDTDSYMFRGSYVSISEDGVNLLHELRFPQSMNRRIILKQTGSGTIIHVRN
jgi:hypothetical protein